MTRGELSKAAELMKAYDSAQLAGHTLEELEERASELHATALRRAEELGVNRRAVVRVPAGLSVNGTLVESETLPERVFEVIMYGGVENYYMLPFVFDGGEHDGKLALAHYAMFEPRVSN